MSSHDLQLLPGLTTAAYVLDPLQAAMSHGGDSELGPNIGRDGRNLTVMFLSCNRSALSLRLLASIAEHLPGFKGEVLIVDNGSAPEELQQLRDECAELTLRIRIMELGRNFGVAGGRNRGLAECSTDWVMSLDNDIFLIANPLAAIQQDIAALGCRYLNLPLLQPDRRSLYALGGHLYVSSGDRGVQLGGGPVSVIGGATSAGPFLSTFLFGGASVCNRSSLLRMGGFDEGMFVGFEDVELSLRLFREGMKIGNTRVLAAVHDHQAPRTSADLDYERRRFAQEALRESAGYFEDKHGIQAWADGVERWLTERHQQLGLDREESTPPRQRVSRRPKIALVLDVEGWAFSNIAHQLQKHLSQRYDFRPVPMDQLDNHMELLLATEDCDLVHFFWRDQMRQLRSEYLRPYAENLTSKPDALLQRLLDKRLFTTAVYDHLYLRGEDAPRHREIFERAAAYYVSSRKLDAIYRRLPGYRPPAAILEDGVDTTLFTPRRLERFLELEQRPLVVGWAGNSKWGTERDYDYKGVHTVLRPALDELAKEGHRLVAHFADRSVERIPHKHMPEYYSQIDVLICASKIEGTPNPVLEAMACGVPIISTDVGVVRDALGPQQADMILEERSVPCLKEALTRLVAEPGLALTLSEENQRYAKAWDWSKKARAFGDFFDGCLERGSR